MTDALAQQAALEPLRAALLARAQSQADRLRAAGEEEGRRAVDAAQQQADSVLARARAHGQADAAELRATEHARARRAARAVVLQAQRAAYDELCRQAGQAVGRLLADPGHHDRLTALVRGRIGDEAVIREGPGGGILAQTPDGLGLDASVGALVQRGLGDLDVGQLWAPR